MLLNTKYYICYWEKAATNAATLPSPNANIPDPLCCFCLFWAWTTEIEGGEFAEAGLADGHAPLLPDAVPLCI